MGGNPIAGRVRAGTAVRAVVPFGLHQVVVPVDRLVLLRAVGPVQIPEVVGAHVADLVAVGAVVRIVVPPRGPERVGDALVVLVAGDADLGVGGAAVRVGAEVTGHRVARSLRGVRHVRVDDLAVRVDRRVVVGAVVG